MTGLFEEPWLLMLAVATFLLGLFLGSRLPVRASKKVIADRPRESPDYIEGMHDILTGDIESAIERLSRVVELSTEPVEIYLALGYLYRQKGQVDRAIRVHQSLLMRGSLRPEERVLALNALGADFKSAGLLDRALSTFQDAAALHPKDTFALSQLVKLSEDIADWDGAYGYAVRLQEVQRHKDPRAISYLLTQKSLYLIEQKKYFRASWQLHRAIRLLPDNMLAYIHLVKIYLAAGKGVKARRVIHRAINEMPHKSYMVFPELKEAHLQAGDVESYLKTLWVLGREHHQKRALIAYLQEVLDLKRMDVVPLVVKDLVHHFGRSKIVQRTIWDLHRKGILTGELLREVGAEFSESEQMQDPYTCIYCSYKTQEILHRCPNCKEWNSFSDSE